MKLEEDGGCCVRLEGGCCCVKLEGGCCCMKLEEDGGCCVKLEDGCCYMKLEEGGGCCIKLEEDGGDDNVCTSPSSNFSNFLRTRSRVSEIGQEIQCRVLSCTCTLTHMYMYMYSTCSTVCLR